MKIPRNHKLFYGSSVDRGLDILLSMWDAIKTKFPDATLDICYGQQLFQTFYANNAERMAWLAKVNELAKKPGITDHGRVGKQELQIIREQCGIWVYPTYFTEIFCMTAIETQRDGLVPVTMNLGALPETVKAGVLVEGDIYEKEVQEEYLKQLLAVMEGSHWKQNSDKAKVAVNEFDWDKIAEKWIEVFKAKTEKDQAQEWKDLLLSSLQ